MTNSKKHSLTAKQADEMNRLFALGKYAPDYDSKANRLMKDIRNVFRMYEHNRKRLKLKGTKK